MHENASHSYSISLLLLYTISILISFIKEIQTQVLVAYILKIFSIVIANRLHFAK